MKFSSFLSIALSFTLSAQAAQALGSSAVGPIPNGAARLQAQRLVFGNDSTKTERLQIAGRSSAGEECSIEIRKTRYGIYFSVVTLSGNDISVGITNSHFTTQDLKFDLDTNTGALKFERLGVVNISDRGEDYGFEGADLRFEKTRAGLKVKSLEVSYEPLTVDYDGRTPVYTPAGDTAWSDCRAI